MNVCDKHDSAPEGCPECFGQQAVGINRLIRRLNRKLKRIMDKMRFVMDELDEATTRKETIRDPVESADELRGIHKVAERDDDGHP